VPRRFSEVRAVWVVRGSLTRADRIRALVDRAERAGINTLIVQVRGRGDAYYSGSPEPRAEALADAPPGFDPLGLVIEEAHGRGIAVHAWVNTFLVASASALPVDPGHLARARPDLLAVPRELAGALYHADPYAPAYVEALRRHADANRATVEGLYASPAHPEVRNRVYEIWMRLATRYPLDGIHFDYVRYPGPSYDYSRASLDAFRRWASDGVAPDRRGRLDAAARSDPLAWVDALPEEWAEFRRAQVTLLVERVYRGVKATRPDLVVSAAVFADAVDAYRGRFQDWKGWLDAGIVDVVAPMAYTPHDPTFRRQVREAVEAAGDPRRVWAGVGAHRNGVEGTVRKIAIAREVGAGGVSLFSYDWMVGEGSEVAGGPFLQEVGRRSFRRR
jgi:uncharacterized lipoprotein YddW (UPF0748 family)